MSLEKGPEDINPKLQTELKLEGEIRVEKQENAIEDTTSFEKAVDEGRFKEAEAWMMENYEKDKDPKRFLDHKSRYLFRAYMSKALSDNIWDDAKRMVALAQNKSGRKDRAKKWKTKSKQDYTDPIEPDPEQDTESMDKNKTSYFEALVKEKRLDDAEAWMMENRDNKNEDGKPKYKESWFNDRTYHLFEAYIKKESWSDAKRMVEIVNDDKTTQQGRATILEAKSGTKYDEI